ncbi:MAG: dicarboxylate/amino acid:cation symporter [Gemmatimonadota bacterium]|nr:dicarboxylate/amino acid:cation symporter [Gemmatimonadota bacterium]
MNQRATALGLTLGLALGLLASATDIVLLGRAATAVAPLGTLFINAIRMVAIPLVITTIFVGIARLGDPRALGKLGGTALGFFWGTTVPAIAIGMVFMKIALSIFPVAVQPPASAEVVGEIPGLLDFLLRLIPANPFSAAADGALLPLIVFTLLAAAGAGALAEERRQRLIVLAEDISEMFIRLIGWILWTAPVGVFALASPAVAQMGLSLLASLAVLVVTVVIGLFVFMALFYLTAVRFWGRKGIGQFIRGVAATYVIGFSTTSSVASLPVMFQDAATLGVSPTVSSLVLSLGAAINRAGSALFQAAAVVFLAALYGVSLPATALMSAGAVGFLVAMSVAPVPSASIVTLAPILEVAGVPVAGLGILLGIDRIPDMFRSATNITGHVAAAVTVEGMFNVTGNETSF